MIDGGDGTDTLLLFEPSSDFTVTTLGGITKIVGKFTAGTYSYDTITMQNVEKIQYSNETVNINTSTPGSIITGRSYSETITGTSGDDTIDSRGGSDIIDGGGGTDTLLLFEPSTDFTVTTSPIVPSLFIF